MIETQASISKWATDTFGPVKAHQIAPNMATAVRANKEMAELLGALAVYDGNPAALDEAADVVILLFVLASRIGGNLMAEVDRKMALNRSRKWKVDDTGHGYQVPEVPAHG